jgi:hypothetical protein
MNTLNKYIWSLSPLFRKLLIVLTKYVVYVLCLLLLIDYSEKLIAYFEGMDGYAYLFTPISFSITLYVKITLIAAILLLLLAISLHFCWKYLLGVLYIFAVLIQREYLDTIFTSNSAFLTICYTNIAVILVILFLGIQQFFRNIKSGQH